MVVAVGVGGCDGSSLPDGGSDGGAPDAGGAEDASLVDAPPAGCTRNADCADGEFCNGAEICGTDGRCVAGATPCMNAAAPGTCDEDSDHCDAECPWANPLHHRPGHACPPEPACIASSDCDDGDPCNGTERCYGAGFPFADSCGCFSDGVVQTCTSDAECDDGVFCNGIERCGASGCSACGPSLTARCLPTQECIESTDRCVAIGCMDADGDAHSNLVCGDDCADDDANRFPGRMEVCDATNQDEDCDPATYGDRDADGDGWVDAACCNEERGMRTCGPDCNDSAPAVSPVGTETCNGADDDCDGAIDEGLRVALSYDLDGDGHGSPACQGEACPGAPGTAELADDCDDTNPAIHPGTQSCGASGGYRRCLPGGVTGAEAPCPGGADCHPQPDGTGLCL